MKTKQKKHIVMLNKAYPPWVGGVERHVKDISEALASRGWRVSVICCNSGCFETKEWINGVNIIRVPRLGTLLSLPIVTRFFKRLEELKPDIVHIHTPFPLGWFAANQVLEQCPIVCTWHSDIIRQRLLKPVYWPFERLFLSRCDRIITTSPKLLENSSALKSFKHKCEVIPLAVMNHLQIEPSYAMNQIRSLIKSPYILFVGRLVGYKGLNYLIQAMDHVDANLLIVGDGPQKEKLHRMASHNSRIHFLGERRDEDLPFLYQHASVFVLPSITRNEAFGYVLLDAMQHGCPVISTNLPTGVSWVNQHEKTGLVISPRNPSAIAEALNRILSDTKFRTELSHNAIQRVREQFNLSLSIKHIEEMYINL